LRWRGAIRLGHSKIGITLGLYSHVIPGMQEQAVSKIDAAIRMVANGDFWRLLL
jgi:hypothetical protein